MGILPLQFTAATNALTYALDGSEYFSLAPITLGQKSTSLHVRRVNGEALTLPAIVRIDTPNEFAYYQNGCILPYVLRRLANGSP